MDELPIFPDMTLDAWAETALEDRSEVLEEVKQAAYLEIRNWHAEDLRDMTGGATPEERDTWPKQVAWSHIYLDALAEIAQGYDPATVMAEKTSPEQPTPGECGALLTGLMLEPEVAAVVAQGADPAAFFASKIVSKDMATNQLIVAAGSSKRGAEKAIEVATTPMEIASLLLVFETVRAERRAQFLGASQ